MVLIVKVAIERYDIDVFEDVVYAYLLGDLMLHIFLTDNRLLDDFHRADEIGFNVSM